jgi:hypothetical protein
MQNNEIDKKNQIDKKKQIEKKKKIFFTIFSTLLLTAIPIGTSITTL